MAKRIIRIVLEILSLLALLGTVVFLIIYWNRIPEQVPTHFGIHGEIDRWGGKRILIFEPIIMAALYLLLSFAKTLRVRSAGGQTRVPAPPLLFSAMKLALLGGISYLTVCTALMRPLGVWFHPVLFGAVFLPIILYTVIVAPKLQ